MLTLRILCHGTLKEEYLRAACAEYKKRLGAYGRVEILEAKDDPRGRTAGGRHADRSARRVHPRQGGRSRVLHSACTAHPHRAPAASAHRGTGAGAPEGAAGGIFPAHGRALRPARRLPASGYGGAGSSLRLYAGARAGAAARRGGRHRAVPAPGNADRHGAAGPLPRPKRAKSACLSAGLKQIRAKNAFLSKWYLTL